jgi:hypothetical protein
MRKFHRSNQILNFWFHDDSGIRSIFTDPAFYESNLLIGGGAESHPLFELLNEVVAEYVKWSVLIIFGLGLQMAIRYPLQRSCILEIYAENLERAYDTVSPLVAVSYSVNMFKILVIPTHPWLFFHQIEIKKRYIDQLITLVKLNFAVPVFNFVVRKSSSFDQSLLVYFLKQFIAITEPPYNENIMPLVASLASLVQTEQITTEPLIQQFLGIF